MKTLKALLGVAIFVAAFAIIHPAAAPAAAQRECVGLTSEQCVNRLYPPQPLPKMRFAMAATGGDGCCVWVAAEGVITAATPADFQAFLKEQDAGWPDVRQYAIRLNSPGGDLGAGMQLGDLIRQNHFATEVGSTWAGIPPGRLIQVNTKTPGTCLSACAYAFLGGVTRTAKAGEIGFHQFGDSSQVAAADRTSQAQATTGILIQYLNYMGVNPEALALASATPADKIAKPDEATMIRLRITTVTADN